MNANNNIASLLKNSNLARNEARILLSAASGLSQVQLITQSQEILPLSIQKQFFSWQERRIDGEPIAYILGYREFYGRNFNVSPAVLIPRAETEHLIDIVLSHLPQHQSARIWDLGTGSGIIAITLKLECPSLSVFASDISCEALQIAQQNAENLQAKITLMQADWFNLANDTPEAHSFDFIVSNPPYIHKEDQHLKQGDLRFEPQQALTDFADGLNDLRQLIFGASHFLRKGGFLCFEHGFDQGEIIRNLLKKAGFSNISTQCDYAGLERVSFGVWL